MEITFAVGTKIWYTGDMANIEGVGAVCAVYPPDRWYPQGSFDVQMDDGRMWRKLTHLNFAPGPGRRFWPLNEWAADQQRKLAEFNAKYAHLMRKDDE